MTPAAPSNYPPGVSGNEPQITGEGSDDVDPFELATNELAANMVPTPDDVLDDCGPLACLYYSAQVLAFTVGRWAATMDTELIAAPDDGSEPVQALEAITRALGAITGACSLVGVYPPEATEELAGFLANEGT